MNVAFQNYQTVFPKLHYQLIQSRQPTKDKTTEKKEKGSETGVGQARRGITRRKGNERGSQRSTGEERLGGVGVGTPAEGTIQSFESYVVEIMDDKL